MILLHGSSNYNAFHINGYIKIEPKWSINNRAIKYSCKLCIKKETIKMAFDFKLLLIFFLYLNLGVH